MNWIHELEKNQEAFNEVLSFNEYMEIFNNHSNRECRTTCLYLRDMFNHFGRNEKGGFNLFKSDLPDAPPVHGQEKIQEQIYQSLINFSEEGFNNKFILLVGPNGSAKTSLVQKIMKSAEEYSNIEEGSLYTFSWIFPIDNIIKGNLGLHIGKAAPTQQVDSYAHLEDKDITAILTSELKDHPILLIPKKTRQAMIETLLKDNPDQLESIRNSYFYNSDISKRNRMIFDALLKNYKGSYIDVYKHIRVERFHINRKHSTGAVTIEPQLHVDAKIQQITMDRRLASLPPSLQSINLYNMNGEVVLANRGVLEFSDLLKRPLDAFKYLLMTMESKTVNLEGILTELDIFFIGTSNEVHLAAFKQHPDFNSFKGRFTFLKAPYLLNANDEVKIYKDQVHNLKDKMHVEPHSLDTLCMWAVMTRLRPPQIKNYDNSEVGKIITTFSPLEKAKFFANDEIPERFDSEARQHLKANKKKILDEYDHDALYEGKFGISPRDVKEIIYELSTLYTNLTFVDVLDFLKTFIERKNEHDFLNIATQGEYNNPLKFITLLEDDRLDMLDKEVRDALGLVDNRSYEDYISRYIVNVNALIKNETIKNPITGKFEKPDEYFIKEFENNISLSETPDKFRSHMISTLGAHYLDNPNENIKYTDVFSNIVKMLQESFRNEQKKIIQKISQDLIFYIAEQTKEEAMHASLTDTNRKLIGDTIDNIMNKYQYSRPGALNLLKYLLEKKY